MKTSIKHLENQPPTCYNFNMSIFIPLGIVILAMLIVASLQLVPGVFALFYHYALGKYSKKRASILSLYFILGTETIAACLFLSCFYLTYVFFFGFARPETSFFAYFMAGILIALAIMSFFFYFRRGSGTKLFISRNTARALDLNAKNVKTRSDAFLLGALAGTYELIFTLPLYLLTSIEIMEMNAEYFSSNILTILYIIVPTIPLFFIRWRYQTGHNLADVMKSRTRDKIFTRFILAFSFFILAILIICFRIGV